MDKRRVLIIGFVIMAVTLGLLHPALAQKFPSKPITVIIPFSPGGSMDIITRVVTAEAQKEFNVPVVADNVAEAAGIKGLSTVYNAHPDGYTILAAVLPRHAQPEIVLGAPVKILDYTYIVGYQKFDMLAAVRKESNIKTFEELKKLAATSSLSCSIGGMGGTSHLAALYLQKEMGMKFKIVPFKGNAPSMTALLGGHVDFTLMDSTTLGLQAERVRGLAIFGPEPLSKFPGVPTLKQLGYKVEVGYDIGAILGPPKLPQDIARILEEGFTKAMKKKETPEQIDKLGGLPYYVPGKELFQMAKGGYEKILEYKDLFKAE